IAGGLSPLIATGLLRSYDASWPIALYVVGLAAVTTISVFWAAETAHADMAEESAGRRNADPPRAN
ncbi:MAG TPA: MFS transporter, partial [Blastocatellia bacterium]|nr:MFS transporter [Blastocatellia bacterium]